MVDHYCIILYWLSKYQVSIGLLILPEHELLIGEDLVANRLSVRCSLAWSEMAHCSGLLLHSSWMSTKYQSPIKLSISAWAFLADDARFLHSHTLIPTLDWSEGEEDLVYWPLPSLPYGIYWLRLLDFTC